MSRRLHCNRCGANDHVQTNYACPLHEANSLSPSSIASSSSSSMNNSSAVAPEAELQRPEYEGLVFSAELPLPSIGHRWEQFDVKASRDTLEERGDIVVEFKKTPTWWPFCCRVTVDRLRECIGDEGDDADMQTFSCAAASPNSLSRVHLEARTTVAAERKKATTDGYKQYMKKFTAWLQKHDSPSVSTAA